MNKTELVKENKDLVAAHDELVDMVNKLQIEHEKLIVELNTWQMRNQYLRGMLSGLGHPVKLVNTHEDSNEEDCECPACCGFDREETAIMKKMGQQKMENLTKSSEQIAKWAKENDVEVGRGDANDN